MTPIPSYGPYTLSNKTWFMIVMVRSIVTVTGRTSWLGFGVQGSHNLTKSFADSFTAAS